MNGVDSTYFIKSEDENNNGYVDLMLRRKVQLKDIITATSNSDRTKKATCSITVVQHASGVIINR